MLERTLLKGVKTRSPEGGDSDLLLPSLSEETISSQITDTLRPEPVLLKWGELQWHAVISLTRHKTLIYLREIDHSRLKLSSLPETVQRGDDEAGV